MALSPAQTGGLDASPGIRSGSSRSKREGVATTTRALLHLISSLEELAGGNRGEQIRQ